MSTRVTVVSGPPCAGKSTYVDQHRGPQDLVLDLDRIAIALGAPPDHLDLTHPGRIMALVAKASILKRLPAISSPAWVIDTNHQHPDVTLDPGPDECHRRADHDHRPTHTHQLIDQWYARHASRPW